MQHYACTTQQKNTGNNSDSVITNQLIENKISYKKVLQNTAVTTCYALPQPDESFPTSPYHSDGSWVQRDLL